MSISQWIAWMAIGSNATLLVWLFVMIRRLNRLNAVLQQIVIRAWVLRHAPIWVPWCAARGLRFEVLPVPAEEGEDSPWPRFPVWKRNHN